MVSLTDDQLLTRGPLPDPYPSAFPSDTFFLPTITIDDSPSTTTAPSSSSRSSLSPSDKISLTTISHFVPIHHHTPFLRRLTNTLRADLDTTSWSLDTTLLLLTLSSTLERWSTKSAFGFQIFGLTGNLTELLSPSPSSIIFRPSLLAFVLGWCTALLLTSQTANALRAKTKRWWILLSLILQFVLVIVGTAIPGARDGRVVETPLFALKVALLSAVSGWTWVMIKQLGVTEINAALMTGVVGNLLACERLFVWPVEWKNRDGGNGISGVKRTVGRDRGRLRYIACATIFLASYKIAGMLGSALDEEGEGGGGWMWAIVIFIRALAFVSFCFIGTKECSTPPTNIGLEMV